MYRTYGLISLAAVVFQSQLGTSKINTSVFRNEQAIMTIVPHAAARQTARQRPSSCYFCHSGLCLCSINAAAACSV